MSSWGYTKSSKNGPPLTKDFLKEKFEKLEEIREDEDGAMKERVENKAEQYGEKVDDWSDKLIDIGQREFQELLEGENGDKIEHGIEFAKGCNDDREGCEEIIKDEIGKGIDLFADMMAEWLEENNNQEE